MPHGGLDTQSTDFVTQTDKPESPVTTGSTLQLSGRAWLQSRIGSHWQRLREQRREAAAVIVLIVMAIIWSDTGSSGTDPTSDALDAFESYEAALPDFEPVSEVQALRESADPAESFSQSSFESGLDFPGSESAAPSDTFAVKSASTDSGRSLLATTARYPDTASEFNTSPSQKSPDSGSSQQQPPKVKFAGRIQPAN